MLSLSRAVALLVILVAFSATRVMASSKAIAHSYILSLNADVAASARDSIVEALKQNGAKVRGFKRQPCGRLGSMRMHLLRSRIHARIFDY